jgi:hypothetical protein
MLCAVVLCSALQAQYAAALAKYKKSVHTDTLSDADLAAAQAQFNDAMKLFNRGSLDQALVIFDEVSGAGAYCRGCVFTGRAVEGRGSPAGGLRTWPWSFPMKQEVGTGFCHGNIFSWQYNVVADHCMPSEPCICCLLLPLLTPLSPQVRAKVPLKSKLGGLSTLQAAVCYDTFGNARQAEALYKR